MIKKPDYEILFGENLRRLRIEKGLTQTELGAKAGLSKRMIIHYEKHVKRPPANKLAALAKALKVSIDELLSAEVSEKEATKANPGFARKLEKAKQLPADDQEFLSSMIDNLLKKNSLQIKRPRKTK